MQERYWKNLTQLKFEVLYLNEHFKRCIKINRILMITLAILSSSSIATWAIWKEYAFVWALIIAISQVLTVINEYLPYKKRISEIAEVLSRITPIYEEMEHKWYAVSAGEFSDSEINDLCFDFKKRMSGSCDEFFKFDSLPKIRSCYDNAENLKNEYFTNSF